MPKLANVKAEDQIIGRWPDARGHFGPYGGTFIAETLVRPVSELRDAYDRYAKDPEFLAELDAELRHYVGRPSPLYYAHRWSRAVGGARMYLKREDLNHTGAHKVNNTVGQALLAKRMGKTRIIAETGAGQHGVATATVAARLGLECVVYMGAEDIERQAPNVFRMKLLGAEVVSVESGSKTLKDALNEAMRDWVSNVDDTYYIIGTVAGPHPYPMLVRDFNSVIGREARAQVLELAGRLPDACVACVGGGSNAMGLFHPFLDDADVALYGVEAGGSGVETGKHAAPLSAGRPGVLHGNRTYLMQDSDGTDHAGALHLRGTRLPGRRSGAFLAQRHRPRDLRRGERRRGARGVPRVHPDRRDHSRPRVEPCPRVRGEARGRHASRRHRRGGTVRAWRQGHPDRRGNRGDPPVSRIAARFAALAQRQRTALIPFVTAGDPSPAATVPMMHAMVGAGADIVELGVPFSDPMADGPVIQRAGERALAAGMSFDKVLDIVREFRSRDDGTPVVLMGYLNPLEAAGYARAARSAAAAGSTGSSPWTCPRRRRRISCARFARTGWIPCSWSLRRAVTSGSRASAPRRAGSSTTSRSRA